MRIVSLLVAHTQSSFNLEKSLSTPYYSSSGSHKADHQPTLTRCLDIRWIKLIILSLPSQKLLNSSYPRTSSIMSIRIGSDVEDMDSPAHS